MVWAPLGWAEVSGTQLKNSGKSVQLELELCGLHPEDPPPCGPSAGFMPSNVPRHVYGIVFQNGADAVVIDKT